MPVISVRVDEETKAAMDERETVNWSAVLRRSIEAELADDHERDLARAVLLTERVRNSISADEATESDTTDSIRRFRDMSTEERRSLYE